MKLINIVKDVGTTVGELDSTFLKAIESQNLIDAGQLSDAIHDSLVDSINTIDWESLSDVNTVTLAVKIEEELHHAGRVSPEMTVVEFLEWFGKELLEANKELSEVVKELSLDTTKKLYTKCFRLGDKGMS